MANAGSRERRFSRMLVLTVASLAGAPGHADARRASNTALESHLCEFVVTCNCF